jgi:hypothetical protein
MQPQPPPQQLPQLPPSPRGAAAARPADELLMDRLEMDASRGVHVGPKQTIAMLRTELRRAGEQLHSMRGLEQQHAARAEANENALTRQEQLLGRQVVLLQQELAEQRHSEAVAQAAARDGTLRQAQILQRSAAAAAAEESARHAAEVSGLRRELALVQENQASHAEAQRRADEAVRGLVSELSGLRGDLDHERRRAAIASQAVEAERARLASENEVDLARERDRVRQLAAIERDEERKKLHAEIEAERAHMRAELAELRLETTREAHEAAQAKAREQIEAVERRADRAAAAAAAQLEAERSAHAQSNAHSEALLQYTNVQRAATKISAAMRGRIARARLGRTEVELVMIELVAAVERGAAADSRAAAEQRHLLAVSHPFFSSHLLVRVSNQPAAPSLITHAKRPGGGAGGGGCGTGDGGDSGAARRDRETLV